MRVITAMDWRSTEWVEGWIPVFSAVTFQRKGDKGRFEEYGRRDDGGKIGLEGDRKPMKLRFEVVSGVDRVDRSIWNQLAEPAGPTMDWDYFYCLEKSGVLGSGRGYLPHHLLAYDGVEPVAVMPMFERDRAWIEFGDGGLIQFLSELTGLPYYLGLSATVPFTPVPGYQFLIRSDVDAVETSRQLLHYVDYLCHTNNFLTSRLYFLASEVRPRLHDVLLQTGYIAVSSEYCLWINRDYTSFDDYLAGFKAPRRHKIRRELRAIREAGIGIDMVAGTELPERCYLSMYDLYLRTWSKHMGEGIRPFLNETFFLMLKRFFAHRCRFAVASRERTPQGMALFYEKGQRLYGRYWGCFQEVPFLHFATCYYRPIRYAIERRIRTMDPGFGGIHKTYRGFRPVEAHHYIKFHGGESSRLAHSILQRMEVTPRVVGPR